MRNWAKGVTVENDKAKYYSGKLELNYYVKFTEGASMSTGVLPVESIMRVCEQHCCFAIIYDKGGKAIGSCRDDGLLFIFDNQLGV